MTGGRRDAARADAAARAVLVETPVHGRVLMRDAPAPAGVLVGFHGYAEDAEAAMDRLAGIPGAGRWTLVAIQGLNRFYRGRSSETVAGWMTRQDREQAIADNIEYVNRVLARVPFANGATGPFSNGPYAGDPVVFAGFSQGVAMAFRAAVRGAVPAAGIIAVGGDVPPELLEGPDTRFPPTLLIRGARDDWYTQEKFDADVAALAARGAALTSLVLDAGHEWTPEVAAATGKFLQRLYGA